MSELESLLGKPPTQGIPAPAEITARLLRTLDALPQAADRPLRETVRAFARQASSAAGRKVTQGPWRREQEQALLA